MSLIDALLLEPQTFEVWIAFRKDGVKGTGTLSDPYNGSTTARFDAIMNMLASMASSGIVIHLGPDTFTTVGYSDSNPALGWQIKPGMRIVGSGIKETTLQIVNPSGSDVLFFAIGHRLNDGASHPSPTPVMLAEVVDLTIDCNLPGSGTMACGAVRLMGDHVRIRNVRAIGWGTRSASQPCFVFSLITGDRSGGTYEPINAGMEGCIAELPSTNNSGSVSVFHAGGSGSSAVVPEAFGMLPFIRNCFVDGGSAGLSADIRGISLNWCKGAVVEGNQIHNIKTGGPYLVNATCRDVIIRSNVYKNVSQAGYWKIGNLSTSIGSGSLTRDGTSATISMASAHNLATGDRVKIDSSNNEFDGIYVVEATGDSVFKVTVPLPKTGALAATITSVQKVFSISNILFEKNLIELATGSSGSVAIQVDDGKADEDPTVDAPDYDGLEAIIRDNRIRYLDGQFDASYTGTGIKICGIKNVIVENNSLKLVTSTPIQDFRCGTAAYFNNKTPDGLLIHRAKHLSGTATKYSEPETDLEDTFVFGYLERR